VRYARWNASLLTGHATVDAQHRELFALVNDLNAATIVDRGDESTVAALNRILSYATNHFSTEEALMDATDYPSSECHRSLHREFAATAQRLADEHAHGADLTIGQLAAFMEAWLETHIREEDLLLIEHVREFERTHETAR